MRKEIGRNKARLDMLLDYIALSNSSPGLPIIDFDHFVASKGEEIGYDSELRVLKALNQLDFVEHIEQTRRFSGMDSSGIDMVVYLPASTVDVQVKSSFGGIIHFLKGHGLTDIDLILRKLIVLNGQQETSVIQEKFSRRLRVMDDYWEKIRNAPLLTPEARKKLGRFG